MGLNSEWLRTTRQDGYILVISEWVEFYEEMASQLKFFSFEGIAQCLGGGELIQ